MSALSRRSDAFWALVEVQHGVISYRQLRDLAWSEGAIRHAVARGDLHPLHRGVYAVGRREVSPEGVWMAAVLACGHGAAISHESAAALWGFVVPPDDEPVHVSVAGGRHPDHGDAIRVHRRAPMPPVARCKSVPVIEPIYALLDLAATWEPRRLERAINEADKIDVLRFEQAVQALDGLAGRPGVRNLRAALTDHTVTESDLESAFLKLVRRAGLAKPQAQAVVCGYRVDFFWPDLGLVVETDGLTYHRTPTQQARDRRRDQDLTAAGLTCLRFTNAQVRREASSVIATLGAVARRLG